MRNWISCVTAAALTLAAGDAFTQNIIQTFQLRNGWNSIWLEVEPTNAEIASVFAGLPLASVWTFVSQRSTVEFIQDQSEDLFNQPGWLPHFPPARPEAFLTRLHTVNALKAYLVKLTNGPRTLTVTGRPVVREIKWVQDSFNLRGFPVNPSRPPTFNTFFSPSAAHVGQRIYQLRDNGQWTLVAPGDVMKHGEAYWAFCAGASSYPGPTGIKMEFGDGVDYGEVLTEIVPQVCNLDANPRTVTIQTYSGQPVMPLCRFGLQANRPQWLPLLPTFAFGLGSGEVFDIRTTIKRVDMPTNEMASVLVVTDDVGTRYLVPVHAKKLGTARPSLAGQPSGNPVAGLWVGTASITNVNEANSTQPMRLTPTRSPFDLRLLVHVAPDGNANGKPFLLQQVIQMWQNGTTTNDPTSGRAVTDKPGRFVLLTDDALIPNFRGASLRDGVPVGRRFSTVDFTFSGQTNVLAMSGGWGGSQTASCTITLEPDHPTNPFKHRYHPDHDNLDPSYQSAREEAYRITRQIQLQFTPSDPEPNTVLSSLDYGYSVLGGIYRETISGLHRTNITATGTFRLTRVNNAPVLNQ